jgi:hypothetical protein
VRIFTGELKKFLNPKILLLLAILAALFYLAVLSNAVAQFEALQADGVYGGFQTEMFTRYGPTLEPEELADFDLAGKMAQQDAAFRAVIAEIAYS